MLCYVFNVRESKYRSKRDDKPRDGWNVSLVCLEGSKFHLETFIDKKDDVFYKKDGSDLSKVFCAGFWDIDIYEFEVRGDNGISMYQKKIIKVYAHKTLEDAKPYLEPKKVEVKK